MAVGLIAAQANTWLDGLTGWFVQLHTASPGAAGTTAVCTGTVGATRKQATMGSAAGGSKSMTSMASNWVTWDGGSVTISHVSVWTLASGGTCLFTAALTTPKPINDGDTYQQSSLVASLNVAS